MVICENCNHEMARDRRCICPKCGYIMHVANKKGYKKKSFDREKAEYASKVDAFIEETDNGD